jgi:catechol 2,3-dioxygenase-like lactoylglutathione lyase family enzyme
MSTSHSNQARPTNVERARGEHLHARTPVSDILETFTRLFVVVGTGKRALTMNPIECLVETAVYADDLDQAERFYGGVLGLQVLAREEGRHVFFQVGDRDVLLVFRPQATLEHGHLPPHGCRGSGHFAMGIATDDVDAWRRSLLAHSVVIEHEQRWPLGGRSLYFRDPAGNSVELITPGVWGLPAGW